jgi:hypothetical protein
MEGRPAVVVVSGVIQLVMPISLTNKDDENHCRPGDGGRWIMNVWIQTCPYVSTTLTQEREPAHLEHHRECGGHLCERRARAERARDDAERHGDLGSHHMTCPRERRTG